MRFSSRDCFPLFLTLLFAALFSSCQSNGKDDALSVSREDIRDYDKPEYSLKSRHIRQDIRQLLDAEQARMYADNFTRAYYREERPFVWITRRGIDHRADTLLRWIENAREQGMSPSCFHAKEIAENLQDLRNLDFTKKDVNQVMATLEYRLTQAYLRYTAGQRYGYTNPHHFMNRLLVEEVRGDKSIYRQLYDKDTPTASDSFYHVALTRLHEGKVGEFLREVQPSDSLYKQLQQEYLRTEHADSARARLARINMERARWRSPQPHGKYVWVNLAAFQLTAVDEGRDTSFTMKVCGGNQTHKTPLLSSAIRLVELNPYWIIPTSIVRKEIIPRHTGDIDYFSRNRYRVLDKESGEEVSPEFLTGDELTSGKYTIRQDNGAGNSLGRMIFRFPNNFSVFLHDTNNRGAFNREIRAASHGCIRLERPLDLAVFLMDKPDSIIIDKMRMAIDKPPLTQWGKRYLAENPDHQRLGSYTYKPTIPVFIDYYTLYPNLKGELQEHPDVYHYDEEMEKLLEIGK